MKRNEIVQRLIKEGFNQNTLVNMSDKQISMLSERVLGEAPKPSITVGPKNMAAAVELAKQGVDVKVSDKEVVEGSGVGPKVTKGHNGIPEFMDSKKLKKEKEDPKKKDKEEPKKKKTEKKSLNLKKLEDLDKKEIKEWVETLIENNYHPLTTKDEIMELVKQKLNEGPGPLVADPDVDVEPDIDVEPDVDSPSVNPDTDPYVDPWDNPGVGPDPDPKFQSDKGMPEFFKFKQILQSINEKKDFNSLSESIMRKIKKVLNNG
jgi:hypothetical protein